MRCCSTSLVSSLILLLSSFLAAFTAAQSWIQLPGSVYNPSEGWGFNPSTSWPLTSVGSSIIPQTPDAELQSMLAEVDPKRIQRIVTTLAAFRTRHTLSNQTDPKRGIGAARDWIYKEMSSFATASGGNMTVELQSYIQGVAERIYFPVRISNVVAKIEGGVDPNRTYVVTGHYDSRRIDISDFTGDAPGADDDATGVAVVMELARICAKHHPAASMIFAATAGEEQNLYGSNFLAETLRNASVNVEGNLNNDIVGTGSSAPFAPINNHTIRVFGASAAYPVSTANHTAALSSLELVGQLGGENDSPARNLGRFIAEIAAGAAVQTDMQVALIYRPDRFGRGGDQESFGAAGFPAVRFTESVEDFRHQHQDPREENGTLYGDLVEFVDFDYVARVARVNLAAAWSAANAPSMPKNVTISLVAGFPATSNSTPVAEIGNESQFSWDVGGDPLVAGYELVWRTSGNLQWTHYLSVRDVDVGTLTVDLPKDDLQFGIRAVGKDGKKSPAVWPVAQ